MAIGAGKNELVLDENRVVEVVSRIVKAYDSGEKGFRGLLPPEIGLLPPEVELGSLFHSQLLTFWAFISQNGSKTREIMAKAVPIILENPWVVDPRAYLASSQDLEVIHPLLPYGPEYKRLRAEYWRTNLVLLREELNSDPRKIILGSEPNLPSVHRNIKRLLWGFGDKVASMQLLWHQHPEWLDNQTEWNAIRQIPVALADVWSFRFIYMFGMLKSWTTDHHRQAAPLLMWKLVDIYERRRIPSGKACHALWMLGADICYNRPRSTDPEDWWNYCWLNCPAHEFCSCFVPAAGLRKDGRIRWEDHIERVPPRNLFTI